MRVLDTPTGKVTQEWNLHKGVDVSKEALIRPKKVSPAHPGHGGVNTSGSSEAADMGPWGPDTAAVQDGLKATC
jgi:hypothetical protein